MHDLIQQMCWEIVRENFPKEPNKWSRLWDAHDIERAFTASEGIKNAETISLDLSKLETVCFDPDDFAKMTGLIGLRLLKIHFGVSPYDRLKYCKHGLLHGPHGVMKNASKMQLDEGFEFPELKYLYWDGYPFDFLPSNFNGEKLVELHLKCSNIKQLWQGDKYLEKLNRSKKKCHEKLNVIDLSYSKKLIQMSEFSRMPNLERLILEFCVNLINIDPSLGSMKKLTTLSLKHCHKLKDLPDRIGDLKSLEILDLSGCRKFEKFPKKGGNMKSLKELLLSGTAIKDLPDSIGELESLEILDLSYCSKFEKFPEKGLNNKSLKRLLLICTAIKDLPDSIGELESLEILNLSYCLKFEKFPEKGLNNKSLKRLLLICTAIKDLPDSIVNLESLEKLDVFGCSKLQKFLTKRGNMKSLPVFCLCKTPIKDPPDSFEDLESLILFELFKSSKFEKFPEMRSMKHLRSLYLRGTAIEELPASIDNLSGLVYLDIRYCKSLRNLPDNISRLKFLQTLILCGCSNLWKGLISNQFCNLGKLNISPCKIAGQILELPSSLEEIEAHDCKSDLDLATLLWLCHLNWLKSATEELQLSAVIPKSSVIPEWMRYQNLGSEVTTELPTNWYEDPNFLGFVVSCVYQPRQSISFICELNLHGNGFGFKKQQKFTCGCDCYWEFNGNFNDQVWVWWYPKIAIRNAHRHSSFKDLHKFTHFNASFKDLHPDQFPIIKNWGVNLIFAGDQHNHKAMLLDPLGNFGDNGLVVLEGTGGNRKRRRDDSLPHAVEEPQYKRCSGGATI
ncbi:hypothetical protein PVL29_003523 [Vitis rotundifolia]|nr:hypothetical protein PVL29_003523 [Vitis rotundifolia]